MKFFHLPLVAVGSFSFFHGGGPTFASATTYTCPAPGAPSTIISNVVAPTTVSVPIISNPNGLCILLRQNASDGKRRAPVARSYAARGEWEISPGSFSKSGSGVSVNCPGAEDVETCDITVPPLREGEVYALESYVHQLSEHEEAARFLEQATFGPHLDGINAMVSTSNNFKSWVTNQINVVPKSSHRQFFRKRTNPKIEYAYNVGAVGAFPCEKFSRWRKYALTSRDQLDNRKTSQLKYLQVDLVPGVGYVWRVDGHFRTVTEGPPVTTDGSNFPLGERQSIKWTNGNSWMTDCVGCSVQVGSYKLENPAVNVQGAEDDTTILPYDVVDLPVYGSVDFPSIETPAEYPMFSDWIHANEAALLNTTALEDSDQCNNFPNFRQPIPHDGVGAPKGVFPTVFGRSIDPVTLEEHVFAYDPHFTFYENTVENPLMDGGGQLVIDTEDLAAGTQVKCQNARRSFLNEDHCKMSFLKTACEPDSKPDKVVVIDMPNLAGIRALTGRKLYPVAGLAITDETSPCSRSTSRWVKDETDTSCENVADIGEMTRDTFGDLIDRRDISGTHNPNVVDVKRVNRDCDSADTSKVYLGKVQTGDGSCWQHVNPSELTVFDLTDADDTQYTVTGDKVSMSSAFLYGTVKANPSLYTEIGKLDDHIPSGGPYPINTDEVQGAFATYEFNAASGAVLMCGSPDEVASDPFEGDNGFDISKPQGTGTRSSSIWQLSTQRHGTWAHLALHGADELRQKMAWSLSQIVAVGLPGSGMVFEEQTEHYIAFYDIFVNHAFGNYRRLMEAFSFNVIMGSWLSFIGNKSLQVNIDEEGKENFPDENFAREIMQLFSIGLFKLNMDGSTVTDEDGKPEQTYSIADIVSYARAWTGFERPSERGGVSTAERQWTDKVIDPMEINPSHRDLFPKTDLMGGYIGDKVALCEDLPSKHFLAKGAVYMALGSKPETQRHGEPSDWQENPDYARLEVLPTSPLYAKLCAADGNGQCTLPTKVVIEENLIYDQIQRTGAEYEVDTIRTVELKIGLDKPIYYEYIRPPCVELAFYEGGKKQSKGQIWGDMIMEEAICGNPALPTATPMCCSSPTGTGKIYCRYQGERVTYSSAEAICLAEDRMQCHPSSLKEPRGGPCANGIKNAHFRSWSDAYCNVQVKVALDSGDIAIVHDPQVDNAGYVAVESLVHQNTKNFFQAQWDGGLHPGTLSECLALPSCHIHEDSCICSTAVTKNIVFSSTAEVSSIEEVMDALHIGAVDPDSLDDGLYSDIGDCGLPGLTVFTTAAGDCSNLSIDTIFSFESKSKLFFVKNSKSTVTIPGSGFSFRNPVHFNSFGDPESRDMYHETKEVIDSLFYHPSHPPFLATRLIQRFGISNPSPRFIERVATAYSTGSYGQIGTGEYGDLGALVAAILLDDESRQVVLDADPIFGQLREPLVKVIAFFRSMGLQYNLPLHMPTLLDTESLIGQGSYESPSVFSFFLPEFAPSVDVVQSAGVVAPEAMVLDGRNVLNLLEAMYNTIKFGVTDCVWPSFEAYRVRAPFSCASDEGDTSLSPAHPTYWPSRTDVVDDILDEISLLLTSGRLGASSREIIKPLVQAEFSTGNVAKSIRVAQELILGSPEFHATNIARKQGTVRELTGYETAPAAPYKALVIVVFPGGADSFNMLVPMGQCQVGDQYAEYVEARGVKALPVANLTSIVDPTNQNCQEFGVNNDFGVLAELYKDKQALFFANTGILSKHTSRHDDWTRDTSFQLFAHNTMLHEFYTCDPYEENAGTGVAGRMLDMLKKNGFHTSANKAGAGGKMLTGDQQYNNPVWSVGGTPRQLDHNPTIDGLFEILKTLNGVGDVSNSVMSETWSSSFAASVFENEQLQSMSELPGTNNENYSGGKGLSSQFKAVAEFMKSSVYRKVNREVYIVKQRGSYDGHGGNKLGELFPEANGAISNFIETLKELNLWDSTAIVMGSDFGRSLNPNSNGGSDHAWGGNYFLLGGKVNGGQILGTYPYPLTPEHPKWIGRGRFIPTTPWDAVWNGIGNWMGLQLDDDLDFALPNRKSFSKCDDLFYDTDLFVDGACTCHECVEVTYSPTISPTTRAPTNQPTQEPTHPPTSKPTLPPTTGEYVNTIFSTDSTVASIGCDAADNVNRRAFDKTTEKFYCNRDYTEPTGIVVQPSHGQMSVAKKLRVYSHNNCPNCDVVTYIVSGRVDEASEWVVISEGDLPWRYWTSFPRNSRGLGIASTYESGDSDHTFTEVFFEENAAAFLHYKVQFPDSRNGGSSVQFSEVELPGILLPDAPNSGPTNLPTKLPTSLPTATTPPPTANPTSLPTPNPSPLPTSTPVTPTPPPSSKPTPLPSANPTSPPTSLPTPLPTNASTLPPTLPPTPLPSNAPTPLPSNAPTPPPTNVPAPAPTNAPSPLPSSAPTPPPTNLPTNQPSSQLTPIPTVPPTTLPPTPTTGEYVNTIFSTDSAVASIGCDAADNVSRRAFDKTTEKFYCNRDYTEPTGIVVQPSHAQMSVAKKLRVYSHNNCPNCDVVTYIVSGRVDEASEWVVISEGDLPWRYWTSFPRNSRGLGIASTYESGDSDRTYTEVFFEENAAAFLHYKVQFPDSRDGGSNVQFSEVELPGILSPDAPNSGPTNLPTKLPTSLPTATTPPPTANPTNSPTTLNPTSQPTPPPTPAPVDGTWTAVNNIFSTDSAVASIGCDAADNVSRRAFDKTTEKFYCNRDYTEPTGIVVQPSHAQMSVAKKLRVYSHNNCPNCDVVTYIVSGRVDEASEWVVISEGDLPWRYWTSFPRNSRGLGIASTYESGDSDRTYTEVFFEENAAAFLHYKVQFPDSRDGGSNVQFSEVELPGILSPDAPNSGPTNLPTKLPTSLPTATTPPPTANPTNSPTTLNPTSQPTPPPTPVPVDGTWTAVNNIFSTDSAVASIGCDAADNVSRRAFDKTTEKFYCNRDYTEPTGIVVQPSHAQMSVAKKLRVYSHNNCPNCDIVTYIVSGRVDEASEWVVISEGDLPWRYWTSFPRNSRGLGIASTYESGDSDRTYTEVFFEENAAAFLHYKVQFPDSRDGGSNVQFSEVELPGYLSS